MHLLIILLTTLTGIYLTYRHHKWLYVFHKTWPRDLQSVIRLIRIKLYMHLLKRRNSTVVDVFRQNVKRQPNKAVFYHEDKIWTFAQLDVYSNRVAICLNELGYQAGDEVALFLESRPEFVGLWLGCAKAGIVAALINTNLRHEPLIHSITVIDCKALIFGSELSQAVREVVAGVNKRKSIEYFHLGDLKAGEEPMVGSRPLHRLIEQASPDAALIKHKGSFNDRLFYIYTSGTTGLPKAAIIKHSRYIWIGSALRTLSGINEGNVIYTCIPLYHLAGGVLGTNQCLIWGDSMVIRHKFSASSFWQDCIKYNCNSAQYIGEICRYLLAQPPSASDTQHKVSLIFGNGLRPEIWTSFVKRFNIKNVREFYGSTEGNANIINNDNQPGACGFISRILPKVYPVALIKVDEHSNEPFRDSNGLCVEVGGGECGEFIGKIILNDPSRAFDGYVDKEATEKKIVRNVYVHGDAAFLSGDLLEMDQYGYVYFKDRTGDTFRWKGENVSTTEVEGIVSKALKLVDCVVYGVEVPGCEGRAGMAAILDRDKCINLNEFLRDLRTALPVFSIPVFIRIVDRLEATGTYKLPKTFLQREGYDPDLISEPLFYLNANRGEYVRLDGSAYREIQSGQQRL